MRSRAECLLRAHKTNFPRKPNIRGVDFFWTENDYWQRALDVFEQFGARCSKNKKKKKLKVITALVVFRKNDYQFYRITGEI